jgi:hypothetical protein
MIKQSILKNIIFLIFTVIILNQKIHAENINFTKEQIETIKKIDSLYNNNKTLKSKFTQIDTNGEKLNGFMILSRPFNARVEYFNSDTIIISNKNTITIQDKLTHNNIIEIPTGDVNRSKYFTDPLVEMKKKIIIENNGVFTEYDEDVEIKITIEYNKLTNIHSKLKINYGSFNEEFPEQNMVVNYLTGNEKVLEIGGNIGRNSCVIGRILNHSDFVTLECDTSISKQLIENRFNKYIEIHKLFILDLDLYFACAFKLHEIFSNSLKTDQLKLQEVFFKGKEK